MLLISPSSSCVVLHPVEQKRHKVRRSRNVRLETEYVGGFPADKCRAVINRYRGAATRSPPIRSTDCGSAEHKHALLLPSWSRWSNERQPQHYLLYSPRNPYHTFLIPHRMKLPVIIVLLAPISPIRNLVIVVDRRAVGSA